MMLMLMCRWQRQTKTFNVAAEVDVYISQTGEANVSRRSKKRSDWEAISRSPEIPPDGLASYKEYFKLEPFFCFLAPLDPSVRK